MYEGSKLRHDCAEGDLKLRHFAIKLKENLIVQYNRFKTII